MSVYTLAFADIGAADLPKVGGKGANLGELTRAGFRVPPGFCVTTAAFARFLAEADHEIYTRLDDLRDDDLEQLRRVGSAVRAALQGVPLPPDVEAAVVAAWRDLGEGYAYAVRSSATSEDLPHASFAGQHDTYLNVRGREALLDRIRACFVSIFTDRAVLYRRQNGFDHRQVALSVVVQRMVQPEVAGILFTADPVTGHRDIASIDASFGLGEALVSGVVSADLYQVHKPDRRVLKRQIATKQIAIRSLAEGGTETVELAEGEREQPALNDDQILEIAGLGNRIEDHYGEPQDIEWALVDDVVHITQSRPITSLFPLPEPVPDDDALHAYFSMSHFQVMTDAIPPLALSVIRTIIPSRGGAIESDVLKTAGGRMFVDLSPLLRHPLGRRLILRGLRNADQLAAGALARLARRSDLLAKGGRFNPLTLLPRARPYLFTMLRRLFRETPEGATERATRTMNGYLSGIEAQLDAANDLRERLLIAIDGLHRLPVPALTWIPSLVAGAVATILLKVVLTGRADADDLAALGRGLQGNVGTEMDLAVGDLADGARASDPLLQHLRRIEIAAETRLARAKEFPGGETFRVAWDDFIATYGARGPSEIDLRRPRWSEDPASLLQMVINATAHEEPGIHRAHYRRLVAEGARAEANLLAAARRGPLGWVRAPLARRFIRVSRNLTPLREHHKFLAIRLLALMKPVLLEAGERLHAEGRLDHPRDLWFLRIPEILEALSEPERALRPAIAQRRSAFEHHRGLTPPRVITSRGEIPALSLDTDAPEGALVGSPVSAGIVEGTAKVIRDPASESLRPGDILVAPFTDPGWTPLFVNAAGLVTEVGGLMTHGSLVAREYGIPAVVGVVDATKAIRTGQRLRVHGDAGYVEILDGGEARPLPVAGEVAS